MQQLTINNTSFIPSKIICIGRNYVDHIAELNNEMPDQMVVFVKPNSAISDELISYHQEPLHYEGELCFLYQAGQFVAVGFGLDLTKRQLQAKLKAKGLPWERAKSFDGAAVLSEFVAIDDITDKLSLALYIDGELTQQGGVELMMYKPQQILSELQQFMSLEDGDVVMTGTPKGVGEIKSGAQFLAKVLNDGEVLLENRWLAK